jgi:hypothetical protein
MSSALPLLFTLARHCVKLGLLHGCQISGKNVDLNIMIQKLAVEFFGGQAIHMIPGNPITMSAFPNASEQIE